MPTIVYAALAFAAATALGAQETPCTVIANVAAAYYRPLLQLPNGTEVAEPGLWIPDSQLPPDAFVAREGHHRVRILSVQQDDAARRVVIVVAYPGARAWERLRAAGAPTGRAGPQDPDMLGTQLSAVLSAARPQDSLGFLTTGESRIEVPLSSNRRALLDGINAFFAPTGDGSAGPDVFGGLAQAAAWFGKAQAGDSILLLGGIDPWDRAKGAELRANLVGRGIRLFILGPAGAIPPGCYWCESSPRLDDVLAVETGGGVETTSGLVPQAPKESVRLWQEQARTMYDMVTFAYLIRFARTNPKVKIELSPKLRTKFLQVRINYATPLPVCP